MTSTIFAKASGSGRAGVAVYRISGPESAHVLKALTGGVGRPRLARCVTVRDGEGGVIDDGLALWFPGPHSFTGEDVAELQLHGSPAVEARLGDELIRLGIEPAGPGAFTMRAFFHGKLDLTQAEGLADLLEAETALQHRQAMSHYRGALRARADAWRRELIAAMAKLDAAVDFPDEEDIPGGVADAAAPHVEAVLDSIREVIAEAGPARRVADGVKVALLGPPNAGKSTLFNALIAEERAIVSAEPGTTRDIVSAVVELEGHRVTFLDMAGIREGAGSSIEQEGIDRARRAGHDADVRLLCFPVGEGSVPDWLDALRREGDLVVRTKGDLAPGVACRDEEYRVAAGDRLSVQHLRKAIAGRLDQVAAPGLAPTLRQAGLLREAEGDLGRFFVYGGHGPEMAAEALRAAARRLEELTGRIAPDDVLDDIFSAFCIGK